jgi:hypothetical protein
VKFAAGLLVQRWSGQVVPSALASTINGLGQNRVKCSRAGISVILPVSRSALRCGSVINLGQLVFVAVPAGQSASVPKAMESRPAASRVAW